MSFDNMYIPPEELLEEAEHIIIHSNKASATLLQRTLSVGYAKASIILDLLEKKGVVGPHNNGLDREILIKK